MFLHKQYLSILAALFWITGPLLAIYLSPSINEQPAIWCFFSVFQTFNFPFMYYFLYDAEPKHEEIVVHEGGFGEKPLIYRFDHSIKNATKNETTNGKSKSH